MYDPGSVQAARTWPDCRINIIDAAKSSMCRHGVDAPLTDQAVCNTIKPVQCVIENEIFRSSTA